MTDAKISSLSLLTSAGTWSLAEDASLLSAMQELSFTISTQAKQLLDKMDQLAISTASAQTRVQTTTNNFMLLSNIKFIEARVYEDSEVENQTGESILVQEETSNEETATIEALKHGLHVIQTAFEKVEINDSDSDSDVDEEKIISVLQPKNPYHVRSLPAVIGTQSWIDDDKIGLVEEEMEEESDPSESESEDEEIQPKKEDSEYSESDTEKIHEPKTPALFQNADDSDSISDFSDDDELFKPKATPDIPQFNLTVMNDYSGDEEQQDHEENVEPNVDANSPTNDFANELSSKLGLGTSKLTKDNADQDNVDTSEDEADHPPKHKKSVKLPPKKSDLFDSSDSDDDLFTPKPRASPPKIQAKKQSSESEKNPEASSTKKLPPLPPPSKSKPSIEAIEKEKPPSPIIPAVTKIAVSDVESQSDDDFFSAISSKAAASVSTKTKEVTDEKPTAGKSLFGDSSDEDDIFSDIKVSNNNKQETSSGLKTIPQKKSLFDNSDDSDDLFADLMAKTKTPIIKETGETTQNTAAKKPFGGISMFGSTAPSMIKSDHEDEQIQDVPSSQDKAPSIKNEIESDDSEDVFPTIVKKTSPPPVPAASSKPNAQMENPPKENAKSPMESSLGEDHGQTAPSNTPEKPFVHDSNQQLALPANDRNETNEISSGANILPPLLPPSSKPKPKEESADEIETEALHDVPEEKQPQTMLKKPVGGVSMFGGFDPRKLMKSSQDDQDEKDGGIVSTATTEIPVVSKEQSDHAETLVTLTKSRPKMKGGRKPPTRAGRKHAIESSNALSFDVIDGPVSVEDVSNAQETNPNNSTNVIEPIQLKAPLGGVSMLGGLNPAQLIKLKNNSKIEDSENFKELSNATKVEMPTENKEVTITSADAEEVISKERKINASPSPSMSEFDEQESISFEPPPMTNMNEKLDKKNNLFGFDDSDSDDMFSNMATSAKQTVNADPMANIFGDDSDDDLFSSLISKKS